MLSIHRKMPHRPLTPARQLTYNLHKTVFLLDKMADLSLQQALKLSFSQFLVLLAIDRANECPQDDIARYLDLTEAAVSRQVALLRRKKWLEVRSNTKNRRQHLLSLSPAGRKLFVRALQILETRLGDVYRKLTEKERQNLGRSLDKLLDYVHSRDLKTLCGYRDKLQSH